MNNCKKIVWDDREAFELTAADGGALIVPSLGANALRLWFDRDAQHFEILRTPRDSATLISDPYAYGIPVLFPANRVSDGFYEWDGVRYTFPQNYPNGVHIHGVLHNRPWPAKRFWHDESGAWIEMELDTRVDEKLRESFPIDIVIRLKIGLSEHGLVHLFTVENHDEHSFPLGLAYHTAFNIPFCVSSSADDTRISVPISARCTDDLVNRLPNGKTQALDELEQQIASPEGALPLEKPIDYLYTAIPETPPVAVLRDTRKGWELRYTVDQDNRYWIIWNSTVKEGFVAIEPQTWLSNAMKLADPAAHGTVFVSPGGVWTNRTEITLGQYEKKALLPVRPKV